MTRGSDCSGEGPLVVGLPARNEVGNIARVAEAAAEGVATAFPDADLTIILGDNGSTDGTVEAFGGARVKAERAVVRTAAGITGMGHAGRAILEESRARGARAVVRGVEGVRAIRAAIALPVVAIGGIDTENVPAVVRAGADLVCAISASLAGGRTEENIRALKRAMGVTDKSH